MLNAIFVALIAASLAIAGFTGHMAALHEAWKTDAKAAVDLVIGLVGFMVLWLGLMRVLREAGAMLGIARALAPLMRRLFPDVPAEHPAMSAMILNLSANVLGMANAATPFGLKAMRELETLNPRSGVATDAMALFLAINTAGVAVLPLGAIALRGQLGSQHDAAILLPSILAALTSTAAAIALARWLQRQPRYAVERVPAVIGPAQAADTAGPLARIGEDDEEPHTSAARDPLRAAVLWLFSLALVSPVTAWIGFPPEALPMALIRPLSGSGGMAVMVETLKIHGPDSFVGYLVSVINGSTETTFYVLALYCGSVGVRATRHTLAACLLTDVAGILAAYGASRIFFR